MTTWPFTQFYNLVSQKKLQTGYCFIGDETFFIDQALRLLKQTVLDELSADFNYNVYYGNEADLDEIKNIYETLPMMTEKRLIVIKEAHQLKNDDLEKLLDLASTPTDSTVLAVFFEKIDQRKKIFKDLFKNITVVDVSTPKPRETTMWLNQIVKSYGKKITPAASSMLQQLTGHRLVDLDNEIKKLTLFVGERDPIDVTDVETLVPNTKIESVFQLTDAIGSGHVQKALGSLKNLLDQGENEIGLLNMLTRHVRLLLFVQEGLEQNMSANALASYAGIAPYFLQSYVNQSARWPYDKIKKIYQLLLSTDQKLKSVSVSSAVILENLVVKSCR